MNNLIKHTEPNILHFKRWSNKSYAIFNSIGAVVNIGFLSTLIQKLVTVKSLIADGLVYFLEDPSYRIDSNDESLVDLDEKDVFSNYVLIINSNQISDSSYSLESYYSFIITLRPFQGLFLWYSYSSVDLGKVIYHVYLSQ